VLPLSFQREVDHHNAVLFHDTDQQDNADDRDHVQILAKEKQCEQGANPADVSVDRMVMGWIKLSYKYPARVHGDQRGQNE